MIEKNLKILVKSGTENIMPIRDGYMLVAGTEF